MSDCLFHRRERFILRFCGRFSSFSYKVSCRLKKSPVLQIEMFIVSADNVKSKQVISSDRGSSLFLLSCQADKLSSLLHCTVLKVCEE